ncbi:uncharacterized protein PV06_11462 [Exophiala oligosperma]|uniref:RING-type domain-containing protein n=2 Tax=Chaetothyriales TaxID=34395 RepID=A0A0D2DKK2_9EURO|nr:uncharacterized protein PV06_11462 [Exophiala oligosperma]KAJ9616183.1 hypothetical protein H2204_014027 [Knufia peltigerae]KIW36279.1 hypothetical protein PV06_11462 [Exophiala oligosperma]
MSNSLLTPLFSKKRKMQHTPNIKDFLNDADCEIRVEHDSVIFGAFDRRKFSSLLMQARQLKTMLLAKQAELDRYIAQHGRQRPDVQSIAENTRKKLRQQTRKLQQCINENRLLRSQNQELSNDLEAAHKELEKIDHLRCNICMVAFKDTTIPCGHSACRECLGLWLGQGKGCPWCKRRFEEGDIRDIYLGSGNETRSTREDDDDQTDVLSLSSDSE